MVVRKKVGAGLLIIGTVAALVLLDQLTKALIRHAVPQSHVISVVSILKITNTSNTGSAFGLLKGTQPMLIALSVILIALILFFYRKLVHPLQKAAALLILSGVIGNTVDRLAANAVTDFILLPHWAAFNLADMLMSTGAALIIASLVLPDGWKRTKKLP